MPQTAAAALKQAILYTDGQDYILAKLPPKAITAAAGVVAQVGEPFCALIVDKDEVSVVLPEEAWDDFHQRMPGHVLSTYHYRLLTLDIELEPDVIGFMARISAALAGAGVSILPLAAYSRDHLMIRAEQLDLAVATLQTLQAE